MPRGLKSCVEVVVGLLVEGEGLGEVVQSGIYLKTISGLSHTYKDHNNGSLSS